MENPATWDAATRVIDKAISDHERRVAERRCGLSLARTIRDALSEAGLLSPKANAAPVQRGVIRPKLP